MLFILHLLACTVVNGNGVPAEEARDITGAVALHNATFVEVRWTGAEEATATLRCDENLLPHLVTEVEGGTLTLRTASPGGVLVAELDCELELTTPCLEAVILSGSGDFHAESEACGVDEIDISGSGSAHFGDLSGGAMSWRGSGSGTLFADTLTADSLDLRGSGSGGADLGALDVGALSLDLSGSGGVAALGAADTLDLTISGSGGLEGRDLLVGDVDARLSSSGSAHVGATGVVDARLSGSGSLHLYGDPQQVNADTSGSGDVVRH